MSSYCFDLDGTICTQEPDIPYYEAEPYPEVIEAVNHLYEDGNRIIIFTARGSCTGIDWRTCTERQLREWGVKYHELRFGKPEADYYVDDRGLDVLQILAIAFSHDSPR